MRKALSYIASLLILVALWHVASLLIASPALPTPLQAFIKFDEQFGEMVPHVLVSFYRIAVAMAIGSAIALPIGLVLGRKKKLDALFAPMLFLTYPIPKVVFLPVLMVLFGLGDAPKIILIAIVIFFQTLVTSRDASASIPQKSMESVKSLGSNTWQRAIYVVLPATLPSVFTALRINTGTAIAILFLSESIAGTKGLGYFIVNAWGLIDYQSMFAGIIAMAIMGAAIYETLNFVERRLTRWQRVK